ncbi:hypothetical protein ThvES_00015370 [Thiovulum sp. ES]|nr:hypothetical protein ThvES_00015370 [Thiovulum sp. ES]
MTTIQIDLQEKHLETVLNILSNLKDGLLEKISINNIEDLEDVKAYDYVKREKSELLDFDEAVREIRSGNIS